MSQSNRSIPISENAANETAPAPQSDETPVRLVWLMSAAQIVSWGALYYSFAVISEAMEKDIGVSKVTLNGAWSVALLLTGLCGLPVGLVLDRIGGRAVMTAGSLLAVASLVVWSTAADARTTYIAFIGLGVAMSASLYEAGFAVLAQRFPKTFPDQMLRMSLVAGLTPTFSIPLTTFFVGHYGWRHAVLALSFAVLLISLPIHFVFLRHGAQMTRDRYRSNALASNRALHRALRHPTFWLLLISFTFYSVLVSSILFHIIPLLREKGVPDRTITMAYMSIGPAQAAGRILLMSLQRFIEMTAAGVATFLALPAALAALMVFPANGLVVFFVMITYGFGNGLYTIVRGTAVPELLGAEGYGAINGAHTFVIRIGGALAPYGVALAWSAFGSYDPVIPGLLVLSLLATIAYAAGVYVAKR